jgi:uncharacterized ion transporter superfamily protein YfcC
MKPEATILHIGKKAFFNVLFILLGLLIIASLLTFFIPAGLFERNIDGEILIDSFRYMDDFKYPFLRVFIAPFEVLLSSDAVYVIAIGLFLVIIGGTFEVMNQTGGIKVLIKRLIVRYKDNKYVLLRIVVLFFMIFGAFFGIFEESIALLPLIIILSLSLGFDTLTALGMCLLGAGFGFATAVTNPFSIGIASAIAGTSVLTGIVYRLFIFGMMYFVLQFFLVRYAKKIEANPKLSMSYEQDQNKVKDFDLNMVSHFDNEKLIFKVYTILFLTLFASIILASLLELFLNQSIPAIPLMGVIFLFGGLISGYVVTKDIKFTFKTFLKGVSSVAPAFILILLAVSVKFVIEEAHMMDTILYALANLLMDSSKVVGILFIYLLVLVVQFFIGSSSAKAFLIMPLILPLVSIIGLSKEIAILAFVFGDGYTNVIFPTNGVLLIALSIASISYKTWFKFTYKLQLFILGLTVLMLIFGLWIGY